MQTQRNPSTTTGAAAPVSTVAAVLIRRVANAHYHCGDERSTDEPIAKRERAARMAERELRRYIAGLEADRRRLDAIEAGAWSVVQVSDHRWAIDLPTNMLLADRLRDALDQAIEASAAAGLRARAASGAALTL